MKLFLVTGYKRAGKDTFGDYLVEKHGYIKAQPFAVFKTFIQKIYGFTDRQMNEDKEIEDKRWGASPREFMQVFGTDLMKTEMGRLLPNYKKVTGDAIWARIFKIHLLNQPDGNYVVCDWRFKVEYDELLNDKNVTDKCSIIPIRIDSNRTEHKDTHISESGIGKLPANFKLNNDGTIDDFKNNIDNFMSFLFD